MQTLLNDDDTAVTGFSSYSDCAFVLVLVFQEDIPFWIKDTGFLLLMSPYTSCILSHCMLLYYQAQVDCAWFTVNFIFYWLFSTED